MSVKAAKSRTTPVRSRSASARAATPEPTNGNAHPNLSGDTQAPVAPAGPSYAQRPELLFECGWEVCWQLGGIYTVLRTKAPSMMEKWGDRYFLIGPYNRETAAGEFEEQPSEGIIRDALDRLRDMGIPCHFGRWLVPGKPPVILLDYKARFGRLADDKFLLWNDHHIGTETNDGEVNEVVAFGFTVTEFFRALVAVAPGQKILAHFHEWMGAVAVPRIAHERLPVATVFTTHATLLGRYLAGDQPNFYESLPYFNADAEAARYQILPKHLIEKAAAHASTVFTTVSTITNYEAEKLLGRTPDEILPNGLDIRRFEAPHEFQHQHHQFKSVIHRFVMGHFFPSYPLDLDKTLYFFTSGRYEYKNKGNDLFLEGLYRLNQRLKGMVDAPTVVAFIVTRAPVKHLNVDTLQNQVRMSELQKYIDSLQGEIGRKIFTAAAGGRDLIRGELIDEEASIRLKRFSMAMRSSRQPVVATHDLWDDQKDPILNHLRHRRLLNAADDAVKVIFHPQFMSATSPLIPLDYEQFVRGCHLGVFPSYYEPWGYTPMECLAMGLPAVTTDLSGFGAYANDHIDRPHDYGINVLHRRYRTFDNAADELADYMMYFCSLNRKQRIELRNKVEAFSEHFDWDALVKHYHTAHDKALTRMAWRS